MPWETTTWWLIGAAAALATAGTITLRTDANGNPRPMAQLILSIISVLAWWLWAVNAFAVIESTNAGVEILRHYPALGYFGFLIGGVMALDFIIAVITALGYEIDLFNTPQTDRP